MSDLSDFGPYATPEDEQLARELAVSVEQLRADRAEEDESEPCPC